MPIICQLQGPFFVHMINQEAMILNNFLAYQLYDCTGINKSFANFLFFNAGINVKTDYFFVLMSNGFNQR